MAEFLSHDPRAEDEFVGPRSPAIRLVYAAIMWARLGDTERSATCIAGARIHARKTPVAQVVDAFVDGWEQRLRSGRKAQKALAKSCNPRST